MRDGMHDAKLCVHTNTDQDFGSKETNQNPAEVGTLISRLLVKYTYYTGRIDLAS